MSEIGNADFGDWFGKHSEWWRNALKRVEKQMERTIREATKVVVDEKKVDAAIRESGCVPPYKEDS